MIDLHEGWQLAEALPGLDASALSVLPDSAWLPAAVPGTAHGALLAAGHIPDPYYGCQEAEVAWVGPRRWAWRLRFEADGELAPREELVFEGLDTYCTVWLNGSKLFDSDNMFVPRRVDVGTRLKPGANELLVCFEPPLARARPRAARALVSSTKPKAPAVASNTVSVGCSRKDSSVVRASVASIDSSDHR